MAEAGRWLKRMNGGEARLDQVGNRGRGHVMLGTSIRFLAGKRAA